MNDKEALKVLKNLSIDYNGMDDDEIAEMDCAVDFAIAALEEKVASQLQDCKQVVDDLVSRQAAIDALVGVTMFKTKHEIMQRVNASVQDEQGWLGAVAECLDEIEDLPSAQPEVLACGEGELIAQPETHEERTETHACDLISRQAAIAAIKGLPTWWADEGGYYGGAQPPMKALLDPTDAVSAIENLPSAQPDIIRCNACKHWTQTTGNMRGFGLGDCDYINAKLVNCNGFCYWAEGRTDE